MFPNTPKPNRSSIAFPGFPIPSKAVQAFPGFPSIRRAQDLFAYLDGWNKNQIYEIIIDHSLIDEDLENFPVLVKLDSTTTYSDFFNTISMYDAFSGTSIDTDKWTTPCVPDAEVLVDGVLELHNYSTNAHSGAHCWSKKSFDTTGEYNIKFKWLPSIDNHYDAGEGPSFVLFGVSASTHSLYGTKESCFVKIILAQQGAFTTTRNLLRLVEQDASTSVFGTLLDSVSIDIDETEWHDVGININWDTGVVDVDLDNGDYTMSGTVPGTTLTAIGATVNIGFSTTEYSKTNVEKFSDLQIVHDGVVLEMFALADANGKQLHAEIQEIDVVNQLLIMWTKIPLVKANQDTKLYLYYDETKPDAVSVTAKSVILDIADNYGDTYIGIVSMEFFNDGELVPLLDTDFTAYGASYGGATPNHIFDTSLEKTGQTYPNLAWVGSSNTNQRLSCVFDEDITFDSIVVNNSSNNGAATNRGVKNVKINISSDEITSTTYDEYITNSTELFDGVFVEHVASDIEHSQVVYKFNPTDEQTDAALLLSSNGTDGDTVFHDTSFSGHPIMVNAATHHEDTEKKFGTTSIHFDGTGDNLRIPDSDDWDLDSGDWTIDMWVNYTVNSSNGVGLVGSIYFGNAQGFGLCVQGTAYGNEGSIGFYTDGGWRIETTNTLTAGTWSHVALVRLSGVVKVYIDGVEQVETYSGTITPSQDLTIGNIYKSPSSAWHMKGYIDEFRIVKGSAEWTEDFNPPLLPYADILSYNGLQNSLAGMQVWDNNFKAVYHMNQDPSGGTDCILDSTQNANHGTPAGTMTSADLVDGLIGKGLDFDGTDDLIESKNMLAITGSQNRTMEIITQQEVVGKDFIGYGTAALAQYFSMRVQSSFAAGFRLATFGASIIWPENINEAVKCLAVILDGTRVNDIIAYSDGVLLSPTSTSSTTLNTADDELTIGAFNGSFGTGVISEVRISNIARSAAWIKATNKSNRNLLLTLAKKV